MFKMQTREKCAGGTARSTRRDKKRETRSEKQEVRNTPSTFAKLTNLFLKYQPAAPVLSWPPELVAWLSVAFSFHCIGA